MFRTHTVVERQPVVDVQVLQVQAEVVGVDVASGERLPNRVVPVGPPHGWAGERRARRIPRIATFGPCSPRLLVAIALVQHTEP